MSDLQKFWKYCILRSMMARPAAILQRDGTVVSANLRRAIHLRQSILQKAFTGEL